MRLVKSGNRPSTTYMKKEHSCPSILQFRDARLLRFIFIGLVFRVPY